MFRDFVNAHLPQLFCCRTYLANRMSNLRFSSIIEPVISFVLALPVLLYAYAGSFSRYMADDFCIVNESAHTTILNETLLWYNTWGGRLSQPVALLSALKLGQTFPAISPALLIAVWLIALGWALVELARWLKLERPLALGSLFALLLIYVTLAGTPQLGQSLYWMSAAYAYTAPLPLIAVLLGLTFRAARTGQTRVWIVILAALVAFVVGSFAEPVVTIELTFLLLLFAAFWWWSRQNRAVQAIVAAQIAGALVALALMLASPGNAIREVNFEASPSIVHTLIFSLVDGVGYLFLFAPRLAPGALVGAVGFAALIAMARPSRLSRLPVPRLLLILLLWLIANVALSAAFMAPGVHATNAPPPARALIVIQFSTAILYAGAGYLLGAILRQQIKRQADGWLPLGIGVAVVLLLVAPLATTVNFNREAQVYARFAREWDRDDALLRSRRWWGGQLAALHDRRGARLGAGFTDGGRRQLGQSVRRRVLRRPGCRPRRSTGRLTASPGAADEIAHFVLDQRLDRRLRSFARRLRERVHLRVGQVLLALERRQRRDFEVGGEVDLAHAAARYADRRRDHGAGHA